MRNHFANICRQHPDLIGKYPTGNGRSRMGRLDLRNDQRTRLACRSKGRRFRNAVAASQGKDDLRRVLQPRGLRLKRSNIEHDKGNGKMLGGGDHRRFRHAAIQGGNTGKPVAIDPSHRQRLLGEPDHFVARRAALAAKTKHERPMSCLIADIQLHHKTGLPSRTIIMRRGLRQPKASKRSGQHRMKPPDWVGRTGRSFSPS